jgi:hypothetical protein
MSFLDMDSLRKAAEVWKFRQPEPGESEAAYRAGHWQITSRSATSSRQHATIRVRLA